MVTVAWDMASTNFADRCQHFRGPCCLILARSRQTRPKHQYLPSELHATISHSTQKYICKENDVYNSTDFHSSEHLVLKVGSLVGGYHLLRQRRTQLVPLKRW